MPPALAQNPNASRARLMVVEDELIVAADIKQRLEKQGYEILGPACSGTQAIELAAQELPDLILMDVMLGAGMDGIEAAQTIHERSEVPVIFLTANSDPKTLERAKNSGSFGFVLKPFGDRELNAAIQIGLARHDLEQRIKESERRFAATLTSIADGVIATDSQGRIKFVNRAAEMITGWPQKDALGLPLADVFNLLKNDTEHPDTTFLSRFVTVSDQLAACQSGLLRSRQGGNLPVDYRAAFIHDEQRNYSGAVISFQDVTERTQGECRLREASERLLHKHEELQSFYHTVSHEVKTPLTSAREFVSLVLEGLAGPVTETQQEYLAIAQESCDEICTCINDMLDSTRLDTGKMSLELKTASPGALVQKTVAMLLPSAERRNIRILTVLDAALPDIRMDKQRIGQVLTNLLNNAIKFSPDGGRIEIKAGLAPADGQFIEVSVRDNGCGIEPKHLGRIFDRLYQVQADEHGQTKGLGLGLFICRELACLHGGNIRVQSKPGQGSLFTLTLPVNASPDFPVPAER